MSYPFLIHHNGTIIQGCYPYIGAHTKGANSTSLAGCNIGNYETITPSNRQIEANGALIRVLRSLEVYINLPGIVAHRNAQGAQTACPGKNLVARMPDIARLAFKAPAPPTIPEDDVALIAKKKDDPKWWAVTSVARRHITDRQDAREQVFVGLAKWESYDTPFVLPDHMIDRLPILETLPT
jgi:hypothetical protein